MALPAEVERSLAAKPTLAAALGLLLGLGLAIHFLRRDPPPRPATANAPVGLGGWLFLLGLIQILALLIVYQRIKLAGPFVFSDAWQPLTRYAAEQGMPWFPLVQLLTVLVLFAQPLVCAVLLYVLWTRRTSFVACYLTAQALHLAFVLLSAVMITNSGYFETPKGGPYQEALRAVFGTLLWGAYVLRSQQVAATFTRRRGQKMPLAAPLEPPATGSDAPGASNWPSPDEPLSERAAAERIHPEPLQASSAGDASTDTGVGESAALPSPPRV